MKQYKIHFYKRRRDWLPTATYYREFETYPERIAWCNEMQQTCKYYRFFDVRISKEEYIRGINNELETHK